MQIATSYFDQWGIPLKKQFPEQSLLQKDRLPSSLRISSEVATAKVNYCGAYQWLLTLWRPITFPVGTALTKHLYQLLLFCYHNQNL